MIIGIRAAAKLLKTTPADINCATRDQKAEYLRKLAQIKNKGKEIRPCPGRSWPDCFEEYHDLKWYYLCFHVGENESSDGITIHY